MRTHTAVAGPRSSGAVPAVWAIGALLVMLALLAARPCFGAHGPLGSVSHPSDATVAWNWCRIPAGQSLPSLFGPRWRDVARFNRVDRVHAAPGTWIRWPRDTAQLANWTPMPARYAPADTLAKMIVIDVAEQFLGAYERGALVFSMPVTTGRRGYPTPTGNFRIDASDARHVSSLYKIARTDIPYPMRDALRFLRQRAGMSFWLHGRDMPGDPASHGCIGLYDEAMQNEFYGVPKDPELDDAHRLYMWALDDTTRREPGVHVFPGPQVVILPGVSSVPGLTRPVANARSQAPGR
jgi:L,D-transpeptidase-like protein